MQKTVSELHIGIDLALQYISSNRVKSLKVEEKDWLLNECLLELIHSKLSDKTNFKKEGFEDVQKRIDDLSILKTDPLTLPCFYLNSETVFAILPKDYLHLINDKTTSYYNCNNLTTAITSIIPKCGVIYSLPKASTMDYWSSFKIEIEDINGSKTTLFNISNYGLTFIDDTASFILVNYVLAIINFNSVTTGVTAYWEYYNNTYYPSSFIFAVNDCTNKNILISYTSKSSPVITTKPIVTINQFTSKTFTDYNSIITKPNRLSKSEDIPNMMVSSFFTTDVNSPISYITGKFIYIKYNSTFYPKEVIIEYLRQPKIINYYLGITNELSDINDELIQKVAEKVKAGINDVNYNLIKNDNLIHD